MLTHNPMSQSSQCTVRTTGFPESKCAAGTYANGNVEIFAPLIVDMRERIDKDAAIDKLQSNDASVDAVIGCDSSRPTAESIAVFLNDQNVSEIGDTFRRFWTLQVGVARGVSNVRIKNHASKGFRSSGTLEFHSKRVSKGSHVNDTAVSETKLRFVVRQVDELRRRPIGAGGRRTKGSVRQWLPRAATCTGSRN